MKTPTLSVFLAFGLLLASAHLACAQGLNVGNGTINVGPRGPMGGFNTGSGNVRVGNNGITAGGRLPGGLGVGSINVGANGGQVNTRFGSFGFNLPGSGSVTPGPNQGMMPTNSGFGPQGQVAGGYSTGAGSFGTAFSSQGDTGAFGRESDTTNTKFQGDSVRTNNQSMGVGDCFPRSGGIYEETRNNLLSTFSVDPSPYPSGSFSYGFPTGAGAWMGTGSSLFTRGWYLPPTSTSSVDLNIVSP